MGVGVGATASTDHLIVKAILRRPFAWDRTAEALSRISPVLLARGSPD
jgi:hypothetical protein